ncbi:MAG: glycosyl transferase family 1 [Phycisphaerae bacterium]|nr:glycosyl transferase family 1 [Phycisphaerae bacterium]
MKIMHISTRLILGGSQENTLISCRGQVASGHEVMLVHGPIYGPEGSMQVDAEAIEGLVRVESPGMVRQVNPISDARCLKHLGRVIDSWKPDVVHTHSSKAGILGRQAAWSRKVPAVVHTIHGLPFHPYQNFVARKLYIACERHAAARCHAIVTVADAMADQAIARGIGRKTQYRTIYSGMETAPLLESGTLRVETREQLGFAPDDLVIGTVSRLSDLKGHEDLVRGLSPLMKQRPRIRLLWVGDGWLRKNLEQEIRSAGLEDRVMITGLVDPGRIPAMISAMDMLVHPSYREGLPRAVVQAMLCGRPVVAYDVDGTPEACIDGSTGRLVSPGDLNGLSSAVEQVIDNREASDRMARMAREHCMTRFDAAVMVRQLETLYGEVLAGEFP